MKLTVTINMNNDAFHPTWEFEASRILSQCADVIARRVDDDIHGAWHLLPDVNGNVVCRIQLHP